MTHTRRAVLALAIAGCALIATALIWRQAIFESAGSWLDVGETPRKSDYVLVLSGAVHTRPLGAAALVEAGMADHVLLTRAPAARRRPGQLTQEDLAKRALTAGGIRAEQVTVLEGSVDNTAEEAAALATFLETHPGSTVTILTNSYHSRRTRFVFETAMESGPIGNLRFVTVPPDQFDATNWWRTEAGFTAYTREALKLFAYWFLYGHALAWFGGALAACAGAFGGWLLWRARRGSGDPALRNV